MQAAYEGDKIQKKINVTFQKSLIFKGQRRINEVKFKYSKKSMFIAQ